MEEGRRERAKIEIKWSIQFWVSRLSPSTSLDGEEQVSLESYLG